MEKARTDSQAQQIGFIGKLGENLWIEVPGCKQTPAHKYVASQLLSKRVSASSLLGLVGIAPAENKFPRPPSQFVGTQPILGVILTYD
jgi:hypothetical protein